MSAEYSKPVRMSSARLEASLSGDPAEFVMDPAEKAALASETARVLLNRGNDAQSDELVTRLVRFADDHGLDTLAELWASATPLSLPGALWRLYLVRAVIRHNPEDARILFQRGVDDLPTIDQVVAGAPDPVSADGLAILVDDILRGVFRGELAEALERASAVARAVSAGAISLAWGAGDDAAYLTSRSLNWSVIADELKATARLARSGSLS
jgi:hypothetical protein